MDLVSPSESRPFQMIAPLDMAGLERSAYAPIVEVLLRRRHPLGLGEKCPSRIEYSGIRRSSILGEYTGFTFMVG